MRPYLREGHSLDLQPERAVGAERRSGHAAERMQARLALAHVKPATLAEDAVVGELIAATFGASALGRLARGDKMKLRGSWE